MYAISAFQSKLRQIFEARSVACPLPFPWEIAGYRFVRQLFPEHTQGRVQFGLYQHSDGSLAVAKHCASTAYKASYWITNEIRVLTLLNRLIQNRNEEIVPYFPDVRTPYLIWSEHKNGQSLILTEYLDGEGPHDSDAFRAAIAIDRAGAYMQHISGMLAERDKKVLRYRSSWHVLALTPILMVEALFRHPSRWREIFRLTRQILKNFSALVRRKEQTLVHRDLCHNNIITNHTTVGIIDFGLAVMADPLWEVVQSLVGVWKKESIRTLYLKSQTVREVQNRAETKDAFKALLNYSALHIMASKTVEQAKPYTSYVSYALKQTGVNDHHPNVTSIFFPLRLFVAMRLQKIFARAIKTFVIPDAIGEFEYVRTISTKPYFIGVYKSAIGQEVIAKIWHGQIHTYNYYNLFQEIVIYKLLQTAVARIRNQIPDEFHNVRIPRLLHVINGDHTIGAIFEYINGTVAQKLPVSAQVQAHLTVSDFFAYLGKYLTPAEQAAIQHRSRWHYVLLYPFFLVVSLIMHPRMTLDILGGISVFIRALPYLFHNHHLVLVHRDLNLKNILVQGKDIVVIDLGDCSYVHPIYGFVNIFPIEWQGAEFQSAFLTALEERYQAMPNFDVLFRGLTAYHATQALSGRVTWASPERYARSLRFARQGKEVASEGENTNANYLHDRVSSLHALRTKAADALRAIRAPIVQSVWPAEGHLFERSLEPLSTKYGYDRGTPIDRYYIEKFLHDNQDKINGRCLEIESNQYTKKFGGERVIQSDVLDMHPSGQATIQGDLQSLPQVADNSFDCVIVTQVLGMVPDVHAAISECHRILKPGGTLLVTSKAMGPTFDPEGSYWKFTVAGMRYLLTGVFSPEKTSVSSFGNVLVGQAFWIGMAQEELTKEELDYNDLRYPITIAAGAIK